MFASARHGAPAARDSYTLCIVDSHRLTARKVLTDPAGTALSGSVAAGQVIRIVATEVVCDGGVIYVILALKTASPGMLLG
jgi:hypothetical protein